MPKRIANGLTLLSAVVCVGSAMLVGRSFWRADTVDVSIRQTAWCAAAVDGQLWLWNFRAERWRDFAHYSSEISADLRPDLEDEMRWLGIGWASYFGQPILILPLWLVPLLTAILPVRWWRGRRSRSRTRGFAVVEAPAEHA